jgi:hypothetical protein
VRRGGGGCFGDGFMGGGEASEEVLLMAKRAFACARLEMPLA